MKYEDIDIRELDFEQKFSGCGEDYSQAVKLLSKEFPEEHTGTKLYVYRWIYLAKIGSKVIGVVTANTYNPNKAILCDIVVDEEYRGRTVAFKLFKRLGERILKDGIPYLMGFTPKNNTEALNTYKRLHTVQETFTFTVSDLNIGLKVTDQLEQTILAYQNRGKNKGFTS